MKGNTLLRPANDSLMRVAILMSGTGTNATKILELQEQLKKEKRQSFEVVTIVASSSNAAENAKRIGERFGVPVRHHDADEFYRSVQRGRTDTRIRPLYYRPIQKDLNVSGVHIIATAGWALLITEPVLTSFSNRIFNVHPGDLSIRDESGRARYTGLGWIPISKAILDGKTELRSSTHITSAEADQGQPMLISKPLRVEMPEGVTLEQLRIPENRDKLKSISLQHQEGLKVVGDWEVFPKTIQWVAEGRFFFDGAGRMTLDGEPLGYGHKLG